MANSGQKLKELLVAEYLLRHTGSSMLPTLKPGDILLVSQHSQRDLRLGDVIAFNCTNARTIIVHRVVAVDHLGVRTQGDNNSRIDDWVLSPNDIIGRIVSVRRVRKTITILSGFWGQQYIRAAQTMKCIDRALLAVILRPVYHWLVEVGIIRKMFSRRLNTRLCCFKRGNDLEIQLIFGRRIIGRLLPGQRQWIIMRLFKIFVDERSLPNNDFVNQVSTQHAFSKP